MIDKNRKLLSNETGATAIEYGLITAVIGIAIIGALTIFGTTIDTTFNTVSTSVNSVQTPAP